MSAEASFKYTVGQNLDKGYLIIIITIIIIIIIIIIIRSAFKILTGKPTGKIPVGRPRSRWEDNIRMDPDEIGINAGNWVDSAQDRNYWRALPNAALNLRVP